MQQQQITVEIPTGYDFPQEWNELSPLEKYFSVVSGLHNLLLFQKHVQSKSVEWLEMQQKFQTSEELLKKRCTEDMQLLKQTLEEVYKKDYDRLQISMQQKLDSMEEYRIKNAALEQELRMVKSNVQQMVQQSLAEKESATLRSAHEQQQQTLQQLLQQVEQLKTSASKTSNKSNEHGKTGETFFQELAESAFQNHPDRISVVSTASVPHSGDFHLQCNSFTVMVDCKKYTSAKVGRNEKEKLKDDLTRHSHIRIGWMVCLDKPFANSSSHLPFSFDFEDHFCIVYINSLETYGDTTQKIQLMRTLWNLSAFLYRHFLTNDNNDDEIQKQKWNAATKKIEEMIRSKREMNAVIKQLKSMSDKQDADFNFLLQSLN